MALNLNKSKQVVLNLTKKQGIEGQKARVVLAMDYSGSMDMLYATGTVQKIIQRLVPIAMAFDDDQEMDFYFFHHGVIRFDEKVTASNIETFLRPAMRKAGTTGGTNYAPVIDAIKDDLLQYDTRIVPGTKVVEKAATSFLGRLFGAKKSEVVEDNKTIRVAREQSGPAEIPTYVIFITDGENGDQSASIRAISSASRYPIFFQFVGIQSSPSCRFKFLQMLDTMEGRFVDNANFFEITVDDLTDTPDEELYERLLGEFPDYIGKAKALNLIA